jgi:hypothetical protein
MGLFDAEHYEPDDMLVHPRHQEMQSVLAALIQQLRDCETVGDGVAFQHDLLTRLLRVEKDYGEFRRAAIRLARGKSPHDGVPEPQSGRDPAEVGTWTFERDVCARLARQLRSVGDALAWRVFGFHRPFILALCRNDKSGLMYGAEGLEAERERVEQVWREDGVFALLHDLTNCLRIGDITVFDDTERPHTLEIKTNPNKVKGAQVRRVNQARAAVLDGGPLPGGNASEVLRELDLPLCTHLDLLRTATEQAAAEGLHVTDVPGSRVLAVLDQYGAQQALPPEQFDQRLDESFSVALRNAGIGERREDNIHATSLDSTAGDPLRVPWANYPLHPVVCARLIGDYAVMTVETSGPVLARLLQVAGLDARWVRPPRHKDLQPGEVVMEIRRQEHLRTVLLPGGLTVTPGRTLQVCRSELDRYLIELLDLGSWVAGLEHLLAATAQVGRPWPHYRNEEEVWA